MAGGPRILIVEDLPADAGLAEREIGKTLGACAFLRADTREDFLEALSEFVPDVIVSDYRMPRFDGMAALRLAADRAPGTPVVILTSAINEDTAVECMKAGAADYVIKEHIKRLGQAVARALEERRAREVRAAAEDALHIKSHAVESSMSAIGLADLSGRVIYVNESFRRLWKYASKEEVVGKHITEFARSPTVVNEVIAAFRENRSYLGEDTAVCADGSTVEIQISAGVVTDPSGRPLCAMASFLDLTGRRKAEAEAAAWQRRYELVAAASKMLFYDRCAAEGTLHLSASAERVLEIPVLSPAENLARWHELVAPGDRDRVLDALERASRDGTAVDLEYGLRQPGGREVAIHDRAYPTDAGGDGTHLVGVMEDVTERRQLEAQLLQAQKLEAIGRLAGGIAHDYNNMTAVVLGYAELARDMLKPMDPLAGHVEAIIAAAQRSASLTRQLLAFARRQVVAPIEVNVNDALASLRGMLARLVGEDIQVVVRPAEGLWTARIDPTQIDQILANLATNARDAIDNVGSIVVETGNIVADADYAAQHLDVPPGEYVSLAFSDTGKGMSPATRARIFEPFFTTKETGTGLGLATVFGIVKQNGGFISVYSEQGHGTTFKILLPRSAGEATRAPARAVVEPLRGSETILLVEDEESLLKLARLGLEGHGYKVLAASSCGAALVASERHEGTIHLLLSDVVMPGMNGRELEARLRPSRPDMRTLFMSGYTADVVTSRGIVEDGVPFIQKPFTPAQLAARVRQVLDGRGR